MNYINVFNSNYQRVAMRQTIYPKFKVEILDHSENVIGEITQDIAAENTGSISINYQQGVRRSCTFTIADPLGKFIPNANTGVFWIGSKFKVYIGLADIESTDKDIYWFSQGVYITKNPVSSHAFSNKTVTISGVDKFGLFTGDLGYNQLEGTYLIKAKTKAYDAIKDILLLDMGNGYVWDIVEPILDYRFKDYLLPYDISKAPKTYIGEILIEIANVLGCNIFYDRDGHLVMSSGTLDISYAQESSIWEFSDVLPEYSESNISLNTVNAINIVKVVGTNIEDKTYEYTAENNNPLSPTRIKKIGRKMYYEESPNVSSESQAKDYAELLLNTMSIVQNAINFRSSLLPHLDVNRVVGISDKYYDYVQQRFIVQSLSIPLNTKNLMDISANNVADLPYYELRQGG